MQKKNLSVSPCGGDEQTMYPIITRDKTPHWKDVFGKKTWVQETVIMDYGPKRGVSKAYVVAAEDDDPEKNARDLNRVLARAGYRLKGHGTTLPDGAARQPT